MSADAIHIQRQFEKIGARAEVYRRGERVESRRNRRTFNAGPVTLDVRDRKGSEVFELSLNIDTVDLRVIDVRPRERHLLLLSHNTATDTKEKFLCGHDERHWFVAAVPGRSVSSVADAMEALKPQAVRVREERLAVRSKKRRSRRNEAFVRQGEWFFMPRPDARVDESLLLRFEPLSRGVGSKPHIVDWLVRTGGQLVYTSRLHPEPLTEEAYRRLISRRPEARHWGWSVMRRNPTVLVRGRVRHPDHKTVFLNGWHEVMMNREWETPAMQNVAFLD